MHFGLGDLKVEEFSSKLDSELQSSKSKEKQLRSFDKIFNIILITRKFLASIKSFLAFIMLGLA